MKGLIFNIQRFSLHDGPGIRTTVFFKGCPLNCKWCSNPESIVGKPEIMSFPSKCIGCGKCVEICPCKSIIIENGKSYIDWNKCNKCLECTKVCLTNGITLIGRQMSVQEVIMEVEKDEIFYTNSGGGVTFSGGEPLQQLAFLKEVSRQCKLKGMHVALDTTGYADWTGIEDTLNYIDLVLYDIKHLDPLVHKEWTGVDNKLILENAAKVAKTVRTWFRVPIIPGFNDSVDLIRGIVKLAVRNGVKKVSLLPYHRLGVSKYARLGKKYLCEEMNEISKEKLIELKSLSELNGVEVTLMA